MTAAPVVLRGDPTRQVAGAISGTVAAHLLFREPVGAQVFGALAAVALVAWLFVPDPAATGTRSVPARRPDQEAPSPDPALSDSLLHEELSP